MKMTTDKAIEILTIVGRGNFSLDSDDVKEATKLGIEALKGIKEFRFRGIIPKWKLLKGEDRV